MTVSPHVASLTTVVGRQAELRDLRTAFLASSTSPVIRILTGMGGVGKTSLARAYARLRIDEYGLVWWVRAEDPAAIDTEFRSLLDVLLPPGEAAQIGDARAKACTLLAHRTDPWLLILDNVRDAAAASTLLPPAGNGHVLITSRTTSWPDPGIVLPVRPLVTEAAVELLTRLSLDDDPESAKALAIELAGLPLALVQAASFVRTNAIDLASYLRWYRERSAELHKEGRPADYPDTVATAWQLAIDRLTGNARTLLNLLAFYAPDTIPVQLLFASPEVGDIELATEIRPLLADEFTWHRAIGELHGYNLITPAALETVSMHRLIQAVTRNRLHADLTSHQWANAAHALIVAATPEPERRPTAVTVGTWKALHAHVLALLGHLPPEDPHTLSTRNMLAYWTWKAGDANSARDLFAEVLRAREKVLGPEHPDTLTTRAFVANMTGWAGDAARARDLHAELLPIRQQVLGTDHPHTLHNRTGLAWWTGEAGDAARARDLTVTLLEDRERVFGADHLETDVERYNVAYWTGHAGDVDQAREMFTKVVAHRTRVWGVDHPLTLDSRQQLALWIGRAGDAVRARDLYAELLPIMQRVLGANNTESLGCWHNAALWIGRAGDPSRARDLFAELLRIRERVLGAEHPQTQATRHELASWTDLASVQEVGPGRSDEGQGGGGGVLGPS